MKRRALPLVAVISMEADRKDSLLMTSLLFVCHHATAYQSVDIKVFLLKKLMMMMMARSALGMEDR